MDISKIEKLEKWDIQSSLGTPEDIVAYLESAFEDGDPKLITAALGDIARSKGMTEIAKNSDVTREALYKALSVKGDPKLSTIMSVCKALGLRLSCVAA